MIASEYNNSYILISKRFNTAMRLNDMYSFYACRHKMFVSLFFVYKNISRSILFQTLQHLNIFKACAFLRILHAYCLVF